LFYTNALKSLTFFFSGYCQVFPQCSPLHGLALTHIHTYGQFSVSNSVFGLWKKPQEEETHRRTCTIHT